MKPRRGWMLVAIAVVCLLWSLTVKASMNPAASFEKHLVARPRESHFPSSCQSLRVLSGGLIRDGAGPQEFFFTPDVCHCVLGTWTLSAHLGLNLTHPRVDIGTLGDLVGL